MSWWAPTISAYADWLAGQTSRKNAQKWADRLNSRDERTVEGALAEACIWDFFVSRDLQFAVGDVPGVGGLDFIVTSAGSKIHLEATAITTPSVVKQTGLSLKITEGAQYVGKLTDAIRNEIVNKAGQAGSPGVPVAVAIVVFHSEASLLCISKEDIQDCMTGTPYISVLYDRDLGEAVGEPRNTVDLKNALFAKLSPLVNEDGSREIVPLRRNISGAIVAGFREGSVKPRVYGLQHPDPVHPVDLADVFDIPVCKMTSLPNGRGVEWTWSDEISN